MIFAYDFRLQLAAHHDLWPFMVAPLVKPWLKLVACESRRQESYRLEGPLENGEKETLLVTPPLYTLLGYMKVNLVAIGHNALSSTPKTTLSDSEIRAVVWDWGCPFISLVPRKAAYQIQARLLFAYLFPQTMVGRKKVVSL